MDGNDHDLLIELNTKMAGLIQDVRELKDNTTKRVDALELEKEDKTEISRLLTEANKIHDNHEKRLTWLERIAYGALAIIAFIEFYYRIIK